MKKNLKVICLLFSTMVLLQSKLYSQENHNDDHIIYIALPVWAVPEDVKIDGENHKALYRYAINYINEKAKSSTHISGEDKIIIFKDLLGNAILPEKDQNNLPESISGNELTFTYNSPTQPWSPAEIARLNELFGDFYPVAKQILGNPLFNINVNVMKDTSIFSAYAGLYFAGSNEMVLRDTLRISTICHEMIHAFRDDYIMGIGTFEEGMTRAAECEVFNILQGYTHPSGDFHRYSIDHYYEGLNKPNVATHNGQMWTNSTLAFLRYQIAGYAWSKNLIEDSDFLFNFNKRLYDRTLIDPSTPSNKSLLIGIVNYIKSSTEGIPISIWMDRQHLLNSTPPSGYFLYHRLNQNTIDYFHRDNLGNEQPQNGQL
ncbi:MAG: hypothetical protein IPN36_01630 [Bacteroidetes bacterium]|nr:hypothetical protein [Bacteroidota bacterium]